MTLTFDASPEDLKVFLEEADEKIEVLQNEFIRLEREYGNDALVQEIFRAAHTLKGSSGMIGHKRMTNLTHAMESLLDLVRKGQLVPTTEVVDALLAGVDGLHLLRDEVETGQQSEADLEPTVATLEALVSGDHTLARQPTEAAEPQDEWALSDTEQQAAQLLCEDRGLRLWQIIVDFLPGSDWLAVRVYQALSQVANLGEVVKSRPTLAEIEGEQVNATAPRVRAFLASEASRDDIQQVLADLEEMVSQSVELFVPAARAADDARALGEAARPAEQPKGLERRTIDVGPEGRGKDPVQLLELAAQKIEKLSQHIKVDVDRLDNLMNLVGELVIDRNRLAQIHRQLRSGEGTELAMDELAEASQHVGRVTGDLQGEVMRIRMLPIENVFNKFPRMVRSLAQKLNKSVELVLVGKETELDRSVIEKIDDPLIHLLRNSLDHGIELPAERRAAGKPETGTVTLSAWHEENHIVISVRDDGAGIDPHKIKAAAVKKGIITAETAERMDDASAIDLIFAAGFSTAAQTTDISGRGVGMDIVRTNIEALNGAVTVETVAGQGTTFLVKLPLTLAIIRALLVNMGQQKLAIPMSNVVETLRLDLASLRPLQHTMAAQLRGRVLPIKSLDELLHPSAMTQRASANGHHGGHTCAVGVPAETSKRANINVVAVRTSHHEVGLQVDSFIGQTEIVIKPLSSYLGQIEGLAGVTILGDGRLAYICDIPTLVDRAIASGVMA